MIGSLNTLQDFEEATAIRRTIKTANDVQMVLDFQEASIRESQSRSFKGWPSGQSRKFHIDKQYMKSFQKLSLQEKIVEYVQTVRFLNRLINSKKIDVPPAPTQDSYSYNGYVRMKGLFQRWHKTDIEIRTRQCSITTNSGTFDLHEYFMRRGNNRSKSSLVLEPSRSGIAKSTKIGFDSPIAFQNCQNIARILMTRAHCQNFMRMLGEQYDLNNLTSSVNMQPMANMSYVSQSPNPIKNIIDSKVAMMHNQLPMNNNTTSQVDRMIASKVMTLGQSKANEQQYNMMSPKPHQGMIMQQSQMRQSSTNQLMPPIPYNMPSQTVIPQQKNGHYMGFMRQSANGQIPQLNGYPNGQSNGQIYSTNGQMPHLNGVRQPEPQGAIQLAQKAASYNSNIRLQNQVRESRTDIPQQAVHPKILINPQNPIPPPILQNSIPHDPIPPNRPNPLNIRSSRQPSLIPNLVQPNQAITPNFIKKQSVQDQFAPPQIMTSKMTTSHLNTSKLNKTIVNQLLDQDSQEEVMNKIETQNNIAENIDNIEQFGRKHSVSKQEIQQFKHKKDYDIFHCIIPDYKLSQLEDLSDYKVIKDGATYTIYQSITKKKNFKLVMTLTHPRLKVVQAVIDPNNYRFWNDQVDIGNIKLRIYSENTVIAYQKHKSISALYKQRDFLYVRHLFKEHDTIYMVDKSIEHSNYPQIEYITRGNIIMALWSFKQIDRDNTQMTYMQEIDIRGLMRGSKVTELNVKYLQKMSKLNDYLHSQKSKSITTRIGDYFDLNWDIGRSEPHYKQGPSILYRTALPQTPWNQEQFMSFEMANRQSDDEQFDQQKMRKDTFIDQLKQQGSLIRKNSLIGLLQKDSLKSPTTPVQVKVTGPEIVEPRKSADQFHDELVNAYVKKNNVMHNKSIPQQIVQRPEVVMRSPVAHEVVKKVVINTLPVIAQNSPSQSLRSSKGALHPQSQMLSSNPSQMGVSQPTNIRTPSDISVQFQQSNPTQIKEYHQVVGNQTSIEQLKSNSGFKPPIQHQNMVAGLNALIAPHEGSAPPTIPRPPAVIPNAAQQPRQPPQQPTTMVSPKIQPPTVISSNGVLPIQSPADRSKMTRPSQSNLKLPPQNQVYSSEELDEPEIKFPSQIHQLKQVPVKLDPVGGLVILPKTYLSVKHLTKPYPAPFVQMTGPGWKNYFLKDIWSVHPEGHLNFINEQKLKEQHKVMSYILGKFAKNLLSGKSILNISLPVSIFSDLSILQLTVRGFGFAPVFLDRAAAMSSSLDRFKIAIVFFIAYTNLYLEIEKPFNPILGETYQGWVRGCPVYAEQISHHPPITAFYMVGNGYRIYGSIEPKIQFHLNSAAGSNQGEYVIQFDRFPNNRIRIRPAGGDVSGLTYGQRKVTAIGKAYFYDQEGHFLELAYNPYKKGMFSFGKQSKPSDWVEGDLVKVKPDFISRFKRTMKSQTPSKKQIVQTISKVDGRFTQSIKIDSREAYNVERDRPCALDQEKHPLPSNSNYRQDIVYKRKRDIARAQVEKERLEVKQREEKKLREKSGKSSH